MYGLNTLGQQQFNAGVACTTLSAAAVAVRIFCKIRHKQGVKSDDYWILIALVFYWVSVACVLWGSITGGGGMEIKDMMALARTKPESLKQIANYLESMFLGFTFVTTAIYAIKMSILFFYRRIFFITVGYRRASLAIMLVSTAWFIATQIANLLMCQPIDSFWIRTKPGKCMNFNVMFLGTGIVDTLIDLAILLLPIRMAFTLHLPMRTKVAVAGIFALGGFVVITNIVRIIYIYQPNQKYVSFIEAERWSNIHMVTAFTCACLPVYKPLWSSLSTATTNFISKYASSLRSMLSSGSGHGASSSSSTKDLNTYKSSDASRRHESYREIESARKGTPRSNVSSLSEERDLEAGFSRAEVVGGDDGGMGNRVSVIGGGVPVEERR